MICVKWVKFTICNSCSYSRQTGLKSMEKAVREELFVALSSSAHLHLNSGNTPFLFIFILIFNSNFSAVVQTRQRVVECSQNGSKIVTFTKKKTRWPLFYFCGGFINKHRPTLHHMGAFSWERYSNNKCRQQTVFPTVQQLFSSREINSKATDTSVKCIHIVHES